MNNTPKNVLALGLASAMFAFGLAYADPQPGPGGNGPTMGRQALIANIDLSDDQRAKMRDIRLKQYEQEMELKDRLYEEYAKLETLFETDKPDPVAVGQAYDRLFALRKQMILARLQSHNAMWDLLTDEQREALRAQRQQWGSRRGTMGPGYEYAPRGWGMMGPGYGYAPRGSRMGPGYGPWWLEEE